jgi:hypothetical protein
VCADLASTSAMGCRQVNLFKIKHGHVLSGWMSGVFDTGGWFFRL